MHIIAIGWMFVVVLMTLAEATSPGGTLLGATRVGEALNE